FGATATTRGCYCMWFVLAPKECSAGWTGGNRTSFEALAASEPAPVGLLAYRDSEPVGWAAAGPRSPYARALRMKLTAEGHPAEDERAWLVPCFFVRRDARKEGVTRALLEAAVDLATTHDAIAVEGFPLAGDARHSTGEAFIGVEP